MINVAVDIVRTGLTGTKKRALGWMGEAILMIFLSTYRDRVGGLGKRSQSESSCMYIAVTSWLPGDRAIEAKSLIGPCRQALSRREISDNSYMNSPS